MNRLVRVVLSLLAFAAVASLWITAILLGGKAWATTSNDSDLWWVPSESGWGVGVHRQGDIVFATLFVYNERGEPAWYVAPDMRLSGESQFTGRLYSTRGSDARAAWNPAAASIAEVGNATIVMRGDRGDLTYTLGAARVEKSIVRMTFASLDPTGTHDATARETKTCPNQPSPEVSVNGVRVSIALLPVETMFALDIYYPDGGNCRFSGSASQSGRKIFGQGNQYCVFPDSRTTVGGAFRLELGMEGEAVSLSLSSRENDTGCTQDAWIAGVRRH